MSGSNNFMNGLKDENVAIGNVARVIGYGRVARELGYKDEDAVYKVIEGRFEFSREKQRRFIALAGEHPSELIIPPLTEYLEHFTNPAGFYPIHRDAYEMGLTAYHNLRRWPNGIPRHFNCRVCHQPMVVEADGGTSAYLRCKNPMCRDHRGER